MPAKDITLQDYYLAMFLVGKTSLGNKMDIGALTLISAPEAKNMPVQQNFLIY